MTHLEAHRCRATRCPCARTVVALDGPLLPESRFKKFTVSRKTHDKLRRAQDLLRHTIPDGDPAIIFDRALTLLLTHLEKTKHAATDRPRAPRSAAAGSRHIPAAVRREVWTRDGAQCAFVGAGGRCAERGFLELHHVVPFAVGGQARVENIQLRCWAHNAYEADRYFGPNVVRERSGIYDHSARLGPDRVGVAIGTIRRCISVAASTSRGLLATGAGMDSLPRRPEIPRCGRFARPRPAADRSWRP